MEEDDKNVEKEDPNQTIEDSEHDLRIHPDYVCGIGSFKPSWLQRLAHRNVYMVSYCALNVAQGMFYTYMISILSTVEKRFAVPSKVSGFIMTGNEFSSIVAAVFISYFGNRGHKPRWIAIGMYVAALASFVMAMPEFVLPGNTALLEVYDNSSSEDVCLLNSEYDEICHEDEDTHSFIAMAIIFMGLFVYGLGTLPMYSLGYTYIDDNVPRKTLPAYLGISMGLRIIGPSAGYMLAGASLRQYHDLKKIPDFGPRDPRWVGAWWLGFFVVGLMVILTASFILLFPRELALHGPKPKISKSEHVVHKNKRGDPMTVFGLPSIKDLPMSLKRILKNPIFVVLTFEYSVYLLGIVGFGTFMPKYLEAQFGQSASGASVITGASSVLIMIVGFVSSGFVIQRFTPRARILSGYSIITGFIHTASMFLCMNIYCEDQIIIHGSLQENGLINLTEGCNAFCKCTTQKFTPVCDQMSNTTYFSACHVGCDVYNSTAKHYSNCTCLDGTDESFGIVEPGKCSTECNAFFWYILIMTVVRFLNSTDRIGGTLIFFRSISPEDKSLALGWLNAILCLFAFLPCTIIYGAVVDSTCLVWEESCGEKGNCWIYDTKQLRYWLHGLTGSLMLIGNMFQFYIWYKVKDMKLYDDPNNPQKPKLAEEFPLKSNEDSIIINNETEKEIRID